MGKESSAELSRGHRKLLTISVLHFSWPFFSYLFFCSNAGRGETFNVVSHKRRARYHSRFFVKVGHETTCINFFMISCHHQTYQNYQGPPQRLHNSDFKSHFSVLKISRIFLIFLIENFDFKNTLISKNVPNFYRLSS